MAASRAARSGVSAGALPQLGLAANWEQFALLVVVNAFVGAMVGLERSVLPLIAERDFGLVSRTTILTFLVAFGLSKAGANYVAGRFSDRIGRKPVLVAGWLAGLPVPLLVIWAPSWEWVVAANVLLGVNQGLAWSTTVIMKIDLVGPARRGFAMGLNEAAGYIAAALAALAAGFLAAAYGPRPAPFLLGLGFAILGLVFSVVFVRETHAHTRTEALQRGASGAASPQPSPADERVFVRTSFTDRNLSSVSQAGLVNNLNDGAAWGLFPLYFAAGGLGVAEIGALAALYPAVWGLGQLVTGWASDRLGRKWLIASGMWVQSAGIFLTAASDDVAAWIGGAILLGAGTAMVYPTLLAAIGDVAHPSWRARSVGVYRLWRDAGYAVGAVLSGVIADRLGLPQAIAAVGALTALSGAMVAIRMRETRAS
ncbi:MAG TPA: MFS transporter [Chloroflexota bacterium]|nr:MFS transporter [Chloroflexota bacterium]